MTNHPVLRHTCISCGEEFVPANSGVSLCPVCGGPPEALLEDPMALTEMPRVELQPSREPGTGSDWQPGDVILDTYEVKAVLGQGGFGKVYRVHHRAWNVDLAVKRSLNLEESSKQAFIEEAEKWINLGLHPHIVSCYYVRNIDGFPHTFAELAEGGSLKDWIEGEERKLYAGGSAAALERILDVAIQFAWGLGYAHEQGLVHQDVKPGNVLMTPDGVAKVTDFGLAKARQPTIGGDLLVSTAGGTPAFHSPEQARWERLSVQTDIWSWGVSVLEMFAGELVWQYGEAAAEILEGFLDGGAQVPGPPKMPGQVENLLRQCFQPEPSERPNVMLEVARCLQEIYQLETGQVYPRQMPKAVDLRADSLNNRALSMHDLGKKEQAIATWEQALREDNLHPEATYNLALWAWRRGEVDDLTVVSNLKNLNTLPERWPSAYLLGLVHLERGDINSALACLQKVQERLEAKSALEQVRGMQSGSGLIRKMEGNKNDVNSVAFSPNGRYALSGSSDWTIRLWEVATGACLRTIEGHESWVNSVCFSPDGHYALSGSVDRTMRLWEISTGACLRIFEGHSSRVNCVAFSPSGNYALSGSGAYKEIDCSVRLWEIKTGVCLRIFAGHENGVTSVSFNQDDRYGLSGGYDTALKLWEIRSGDCLRTFEGHKDLVSSVTFSPDGHSVLSGGWDKTILWDVKTGTCLRTFGGHKDYVTSVTFSPDGRNFLSATGEYTLQLWEISTGVCLRTFDGHDAWVNSVVFSPDGNFALSGSNDKTVRLWKINRNNIFRAPYCLAAPLASVHAMELDQVFVTKIEQARDALRTGDYAAVFRLVKQARSLPGYERNQSALDIWFALYSQCRLGQILGGWEEKSFEGHQYIVNSVAFSPDGNYALSGSSDATLRLWEIKSGACLQIFEGHKENVYSVAFSPDKRHILSGSGDNTLRLWDIETGACESVFEEHKSHVNSVAFSADGRYAVSGSLDDSLKLWDIPVGTCLCTIRGHKIGVTSIAFSPERRYILSSSMDGTLKLWDVETGICLNTFEGHVDSVESAAFSPNGKLALSGSSDWTLRLWEINSGACLRTFYGHTNGVSSVAFSPDGHFAISGSWDATLRLWEVETGICLHTFVGHNNGVTSVAFSPDSRYILSGSEDKTLRLWILDWEMENYQPVDWDEGARPYLDIFLVLHIPTSPDGFSRQGMPIWAEEDFQKLIIELGYRGYGWLRPEGVRRKLEELAKT